VPPPEHFQFHGPSVCAMAFRVDDAKQALRAPRRCFAHPGKSRPAGGTSDSSGSGTDGTLLYLVSRGGRLDDL